MISDEIRSVVAVLETLDIKAPVEATGTIQLCKIGLLAVAEQAAELEKNLYALAQSIEGSVA